MQAACQIRLFPKLIFNLKILFQFSFFVCGKNRTWVSSQQMFKNRLQAKFVYSNALQEPSWLIQSARVGELVNSLHSGIPTTALYSLPFPTHTLHKHVEKDWMQLNTAALQSGVESWSASARCFLLPVGLLGLWQQIAVLCPFFSRMWSRVCGCSLLILGAHCFAFFQQSVLWCMLLFE